VRRGAEPVPEIYNVYCDETCHLEHDHCPTMVIGGVWCNKQRTREIAERLREIKEKHQLPRGFEAKWVKVSPAKVGLYLDLIDYFFDDDDLHFRGVLIPDKRLLRHEAYGQDHDTWYYKMFFRMLEPIIDPEASYRIYIDIKDTRSEEKRSTLESVLRNSRRDFRGQVIDRVQQIRSHESEVLQLADLLIGAIAYCSRGLRSSTAKLAIVERIRQRSGKTLQMTTWLGESKLNLLRWKAGGSAE
jgi:hypothetical protein